MTEPAAHGVAQPASLRYEPLVPAAIAVVTGIVAADFVGGPVLAWCAATAAAGVLWAGIYVGGGQHRLLTAVLLVVVAAAAGARYLMFVAPPPNDVGRMAADGPRLVTLEGTVVRSVRQTLPPDDVFLPTVAYHVRSSLGIDCSRAQVGGKWAHAAGRVEITVREEIGRAGGAAPRLGDRVVVTGVLAIPPGPANPGSFDMQSYMRRQATRATLRTDHWSAVRVTARGADPWRSAAAAVQEWALRRLAVLPTEEGRAIVAAMLLGRRQWPDFDTGQPAGPRIEKAFLVTGTTHYLAVSGFNVGMVAGAVVMASRLLGLGRRLTCVLVAAAVLLFVMMTEMEPPVLRAAILFGFVCAGWLVGRQALAMNTLAAAVILILFLRPGDLFTTSFQLSFIAVLAMVFVANRIGELLFGDLIDAWSLAGPRRGPPLWYRHLVQGGLVVSLAASLVNMPIIADRFHVVAWMAPLTSVLLLPLAFALTVVSMVQVGVGWAAGWLDGLLSAVADGLGRTIAATVQALARVPCSYAYVGDVPWWCMVAAYCLLAAWVWRRQLGISRRRLAIVCLAAAAIYTWSGGHHPPRSTRATFLAVGSGCTCLLELPNGRVLLYDAGSSLSHTRAAETAIAPALWAGGVERIDAVFLSHPHFDHFKDILPLVDRFAIRRVFVPPTFMRNRLRGDNEVIEALMARGANVEFFGAGDRLAGTGGVRIEALWPRGPESATPHINDGSLVLKVTDGPRTLLLTGDLEAAGLGALARASPALRAEAMLWPHHGHEPAVVGEFARGVGARYLVVSAAAPRTGTVTEARLPGSEVRCLHTGIQGAVALELRPDRMLASTFRAGQPTFVGYDDPWADADDTED